MDYVQAKDRQGQALYAAWPETRNHILLTVDVVAMGLCLFVVFFVKEQSLFEMPLQGAFDAWLLVALWFVRMLSWFLVFYRLKSVFDKSAGVVARTADDKKA